MSESVWDLVAAERQIMSVLIESLTEEQLDVQSLCEEWTVREVAGHTVWVASTSPPELAMALLLGGFKIDRMVSAQAKVVASLETEILLKRLRSAIPKRITVPTITPAMMLGDVVVHLQDICRPLGIDRDINPESMVLTLDAYLGTKGRRGSDGQARVKGLRLLATDLDWSCGSGPEVSGPAESILMAGKGRRVALAELEGDGVATLDQRSR